MSREHACHQSTGFPQKIQILLSEKGLKSGVPKPGCFKPGCLQFLRRTSALWRSFVPFCSLLRTCVCALLRSFALFCAHLRVSASRTTAFGNCRLRGWHQSLDPRPHPQNVLDRLIDLSVCPEEESECTKLRVFGPFFPTKFPRELLPKARCCRISWVAGGGLEVKKRFARSTYCKKEVKGVEFEVQGLFREFDRPHKVRGPLTICHLSSKS